MAQRRMMSLRIIDTDQFLDMPMTAQALYMHLCMRADDDGFVDNPRKIKRMTGSSEDDYKLLLAKQFVIPFDSGVCVIKHWRIHNYIQKDRYQPTMYKDEIRQLSADDNGMYHMDTECIHDGHSTVDTQVRLGEVSLGKGRESQGKRSKSVLIHPSLNVPINQTRYENLCNTYSQPVIDEYIQRAIDYCDSKGKKYYKDFAAAASQYIARDDRDAKGPAKVKPSTEYRGYCKHCDVEFSHEEPACPECGDTGYAMREVAV